jgi:hypothetical protein
MNYINIIKISSTFGNPKGKTQFGRPRHSWENNTIIVIITLRLQSAIELYQPSDRRLSAKLVPTFADRGCRVVSAADPYGRNLGFLDRR